jgi:hypothetical protein
MGPARGAAICAWLHPADGPPRAPALARCTRCRPARCTHPRRVDALCGFLVAGILRHAGDVLRPAGLDRACPRMACPARRHLARARLDDLRRGARPGRIEQGAGSARPCAARRPARASMDQRTTRAFCPALVRRPGPGRDRRRCHRTRLGSPGRDRRRCRVRTENIPRPDHRTYRRIVPARPAILVVPARCLRDALSLALVDRGVAAGIHRARGLARNGHARQPEHRTTCCRSCRSQH